MTQCIDAVIVFANAHLMESSTNELAVLACHGQGAKFLYPKPDKPIEIRQFDGQYEKLTLVERTVRSQLQETINELLQCGNLRNESLISGALSLALCYISRLERDKAPGEKLHSRVLIVTGSNDSATQYMNYMNIFFTSQKMVRFIFTFYSSRFYIIYNNNNNIVLIKSWMNKTARFQIQSSVRA